MVVEILHHIQIEVRRKCNTDSMSGGSECGWRYFGDVETLNEHKLPSNISDILLDSPEYFRSAADFHYIFIASIPLWWRDRNLL